MYPSTLRSADSSTTGGAADHPFVTASQTETQAHVTRVHALGLHAIPTWGGGKLLRGTNQRELADRPPSLSSSADYSGGLAILCGTGSSADGWIAGIDVDHGPRTWPTWPLGTLLAERGSAAGKWHLFVLLRDRLEGQRLIYGAKGQILVEIKGYGLSLRSWPTWPPDKPSPYELVHVAGEPASPRLTVQRFIEGLVHFLCYATAEQASADLPSPSFPRTRQSGSGVSSRSGRVAQLVAEELARRGVVLSRASSSGWQHGRCPLHDDRHPSFSVNLAVSAWKCFAPGCGQGPLEELARRLGLDVPRVRKGRNGTIYIDRLGDGSLRGVH